MACPCSTCLFDLEINSLVICTFALNMLCDDRCKWGPRRPAVGPALGHRRGPSRLASGTHTWPISGPEPGHQPALGRKQAAAVLKGSFFLLLFFIFYFLYFFYLFILLLLLQFLLFRFFSFFFFWYF